MMTATTNLISLLAGLAIGIYVGKRLFEPPKHQHEYEIIEKIHIDYTYLGKPYKTATRYDLQCSTCGLVTSRTLEAKND